MTPIQQMFLAVVGTTPPGQQEYTTPGSYTFTPPGGMEKFSAVVVAGGGAGAPAYGTKNGGAGGGGGLTYANNMTWTTDIDIVVGAGGAVVTSGSSGTHGNQSYVMSSGNLRAEPGD